MPIAPMDFLIAARDLHLIGSEVSHRNAASRAYYAAYHEASIKAEHSIMIPGDAASHAAIIGAYEGHRDPKYKAVGYMLRQARAKRRIADYSINDEFSANDALESINLSERIIGKIDLF